MSSVKSVNYSEQCQFPVLVEYDTLNPFVEWVPVESSAIDIDDILLERWGLKLVVWRTIDRNELTDCDRIIYARSDDSYGTRELR